MSETPVSGVDVSAYIFHACHELQAMARAAGLDALCDKLCAAREASRGPLLDGAVSPSDGQTAPLSVADAASVIYLTCRELETLAGGVGLRALARSLGVAKEAAAEVLRVDTKGSGQAGGEKEADESAA